MGVTIKNVEVERLADEVARMTGELSLIHI